MLLVRHYKTYIIKYFISLSGNRTHNLWHSNVKHIHWPHKLHQYMIYYIISIVTKSALFYSILATQIYITKHTPWTNPLQLYIVCDSLEMKITCSPIWNHTHNCLLLIQTFFVIFQLQSPGFEVSNTICDICIEKLKEACKFKKQVLQCERKFKEYCNSKCLLSLILYVHTFFFLCLVKQ